jgi:hypothetical protein
MLFTVRVTHIRSVERGKIFFWNGRFWRGLWFGRGRRRPGQWRMRPLLLLLMWLPSRRPGSQSLQVWRAARPLCRRSPRRQLLEPAEARGRGDDWYKGVSAPGRLLRMSPQLLLPVPGVWGCHGRLLQEHRVVVVFFFRATVQQVCGSILVFDKVLKCQLTMPSKQLDLKLPAGPVIKCKR